MAVMEDFVASKEIIYTCMASSQNRFVLLNLLIAINLFKYEKTLCFFIKVKKCLMVAFMKMNSSWTLIPLFTLPHLSLTLLI